MAATKKYLKDSRIGFTGTKKKAGINSWRVFFTGQEKNSGAESLFFLELEFLNAWQSPSEPLLGFKPRVTITEDDLQYALAGTSSAANLKSEEIIKPSYVVIRFGKLGQDAKQICSYYPLKNAKFSAKPYNLQFDNTVFSDDQLSGFINVTEEDFKKHPEFLCDKGFASWNLKYEVIKDFKEGYKDKETKWSPCGIKTNFLGIVNFDGNDYVVDPRKCFGYMDHYLGKSLPFTWFHVSSANLTSIISGKTLLNSCFSIQGNFDDRLAFLGTFEGADISFPANMSKRQYSCVWDCVQAPESDDINENKLHWSVSINNKVWVIDVDIYCRINELYSRSLELPDGQRKVLKVVQGATGTGEIKLFKRIKNTLEQIEYANITKAVCEFGQEEDGEL